MSVSADAPLSKKAQIANALRADIAADQPAVGQKLASLRELADRFEVTTVTVGSALQILVDEGLIFSVPNRGYFVSAPPAEAQGSGHSAEFLAITQHMESLEATVRSLADRVAHLEGLVEGQG